MWMTCVRGIFTIGVINVAKTSIWLNGSRIGE
jgi:hypothetical protein